MAKPVNLTESKARTPAEKRVFVHQVFESISGDYDKMNDVESFRMHRNWKKALVNAVVRNIPGDPSSALPTELASTVTPATPASPAASLASPAPAASPASLAPAASLASTVPPASPAPAVSPAPPETPQVFSPVILDVATGTGDIAIALAAALPEATVTGIDFSANMLVIAHQRTVALQATTASPSFILGDALDLPYADASVDALTISFGLRNLPDYAAALREFYRVLKPGGYFYCLEASYPTSPLIKPFFKLYFKYIMPNLAALVVGHRQQYQWLNDSTEAFLSKTELADLIEACGFTEVTVKSFLFGAAALHQGHRCSNG